MGEVTNSGASLHWLKINQKTSSLRIKRKGEDERKIDGGFESYLVEADFLNKPANAELDIPAHNVFRLVFEDADSGQVERYGLELREGDSITNNFLNSLLGVPLLTKGQMIYFRVYEKDGNTNLYIAESRNQGVEKLPWKYEWNRNLGWFDTVPPPVDSDQINDKTGLPKKDYTPSTLFWRKEFLTKIYPAINGKDWVGQRDPEKVRVIIATLSGKAKEMTAVRMAEIRPAQEEWLAKQLPSEEDRKEVLSVLDNIYQEKTGAATAKKEEKPADPLDDLPF